MLLRCIISSSTGGPRRSIPTIGDAMKISYALALALSTAAIPAVAQPAAGSTTAASTIAKNATVFSADGRRIGRIDRVRATSVSVIYNGKFVEIPLDTLSAADKGYTTTLNKADIGKL